MTASRPSAILQNLQHATHLQFPGELPVRFVLGLRASAYQPATGRSSLTRPPTVAMKLAENAPISSDMNAHSAT